MGAQWRTPSAPLTLEITIKEMFVSDEPAQEKENLCNCRVEANCPVENKCKTESVVYKAKVTYQDSEMEYVGITNGPFKTHDTPESLRSSALAVNQWADEPSGETAVLTR